MNYRNVIKYNMCRIMKNADKKCINATPHPITYLQ